MNTGILEIDLVKKVMTEKGFVFFEKGQFNVNLIGIRAKNRKAGKFDDFICAIYKNEKNEWVIHSWSATTDAGTYWLKNPMNIKGTALLVPNQYRNCWQIGLHKGTHAALVQKAEVSVYRDNDKDFILDFDSAKIDIGMFGINIHSVAPLKEAKVNDKWSAGCQVFANDKDHKAFMQLVRKSAELYGNNFSYTLLEQSDFDSL
jgi:hypothetical protein